MLLLLQGYGVAAPSDVTAIVRSWTLYDRSPGWSLERRGVVWTLRKRVKNWSLEEDDR